MEAVTRKLTLVVLIACSVLALFFILNTPNVDKRSIGTEAINAGRFLDNELFVKGESDKVRFKIENRVMGVIVPHHTLASYLLSSLFDQIGKDYETVIVIGPNHKATEKNIAFTVDVPFETAFGTVEVDSDLVRQILKNGVVLVENDIVGDEHSVNVPINFIAKYLVNSKVVPLVLNETNDLEDLRKLSDTLSPLVNEKVLVVASVDFSHYLGVSEARKKDIETIAAIESSDYLKINRYNESNLDSSSSIILLDMLMKDRRADDFQVLVNTNSSELTNYNKDVTSYIVAVYGR